MDFHQLGMCTYVMEIWVGIANVKILSIFDRVVSPPHDSGRALSFHVFICIFN